MPGKQSIVRPLFYLQKIIIIAFHPVINDQQRNKSQAAYKNNGSIHSNGIGNDARNDGANGIT